MARLGNIQEYEKRKAAATPVGTSPQSQSVREGFQQMAQKPMEQPVLQKVDANKVYESTRSQALGSDAAQVDPQKTMESWNASPYEYWTEQVKTNPESTYAIVNQMFASKETPEEKAKRERREQLGEVFNNLGNLIGNAANLYYTHRGGQYIDLNTANEKHRERMQRIKDKQDALDRQREQIILNAKLGEIQAARKAKADKEQRDYNEKVRRENRAYQDKKDKQNQANWQAQFDWNVKQAEQNAADKAEEKAYRREQDKNNLAYKWAELNFRKENAKNGSGNGKKSSIDVVNTKKGAMNVDFSKLNDASIAQLYQIIPEEIRKKYDISSIDNKNERLLRMNEAIGDALMNVDGYSDWFEKSGVGTYQQQHNPRDYSQYDVTDDYSGYARNVGKTQNAANVQSVTAADVQTILDNNKKKKKDILQQGRNSLNKNSGYSMKSDTFR